MNPFSGPTTGGLGISERVVTCSVFFSSQATVLLLPRGVCNGGSVGRAAEASVTWAQSLAWRMRQQFLDIPSSDSVADVIRRLGAILSTDARLADLALRTRLATSTPHDIAAALDSGDVIEVYAFRGAKHYLAADEAGAYLALRSAGRQWEQPSWVDHYQLRPSDWPIFRAAVREALSDCPLTATELGHALSRDRAHRHLRPVFDVGGTTLIKALMWQGDVSLGPRRDGQQTLQRLDRNPNWRPFDDLDDAGFLAIMRYFRAYGPATIEHLQYWLGEGLSAGRKRLATWFSELGDRVVAVDVEGTSMYVARDDVDALLAAAPSGAVRFLPGHDQWVIGPGTKDSNVTPSALRDLITRKANPVIVGGVVSGTWTLDGDDVAVAWFDDRGRPDEELTRESRCLASIVGRDLGLVFDE